MPKCCSEGLSAPRSGLQVGREAFSPGNPPNSLWYYRLRGSSSWMWGILVSRLLVPRLLQWLLLAPEGSGGDEGKDAGPRKRRHRFFFRVDANPSRKIHLFRGFATRRGSVGIYSARRTGTWRAVTHLQGNLVCAHGVLAEMGVAVSSR